MIDKMWLKSCLTGPVSSVRTPFLKNGSVDWDGLRAQIDFNIAAGSKTMLLTAGDSHYQALSDEEIAEVTRVTVQHTARRALVVAADREFDTLQSVAFAKFCRETGADVLMVKPPDWAASCTPQSLAGHYAAVSEYIPVMVVTNVFRPRGESFGLETIEKTLATAPDVVAVKDDMLGPFGRKMTMRVREHWAVISGGQKQNHLDLHPYGCHGYLSTFISFKPEITHRYWDAIQRNDMQTATGLIRDIDWPFFKLIQGLPGGFDAGIHGVFELTGICKRWRKPPYHSLTDEEMEMLNEELIKLGII